MDLALQENKKVVVVKITAAECGEEIMSCRLAHKVCGDNTVLKGVEIVSWKELNRNVRKGFVKRTVNAKGVLFFGGKGERAYVNGVLFDKIAGKEIECSVSNGCVYIQDNANGEWQYISIPWCIVKALIV